MFQRFRDLPNDSISSDIRGATVYGRDNDKLGTIDDIIFDPNSDDPGYAVVDSGGWLSSRKFLVPTNKLQTYRDSDSEFLLPASRDQLKALPEFDDSIIDDEPRFRTYRERWSESWTRPTGTEIRHPRIAAIEERFRDRSRTVTTSEPVVSNVRSVDSRPISSARTTSLHDVAVYGVFHDEAKVREAVDALRAEGFGDADISVVFPDRGDTEKFAYEHNTKA